MHRKLMDLVDKMAALGSQLQQSSSKKHLDVYPESSQILACAWTTVKQHRGKTHDNVRT